MIFYIQTLTTVKKLILIFLLLLSTLNYSQVDISIGENDKLIYLDSLWNEVTKENYDYYRIVKEYHIKQKEYKICDYYKDNILKTTATVSKRNNGSYIGNKTAYYRNGNKKNITNYVKGDPLGKITDYYENGNLKEEGENTGNYDEPGKYYKLLQFWDENKNHIVIDGNGIYFFSDNEFSSKGEYKNGYKNGFFEVKNLKKNITFKDKYKDGNFIKGTRISADNTKSTYVVFEIKSHPKKGMQHLYDYIRKNFVKSEESIFNNVQGNIYINFVVDKDGKITNPLILQSLGYGLDEEAIRLLLKYGDWIPGELRGKKVKWSFTIPIEIKSLIK